MPWQQSRTIKYHLQRDAEALELRNSNLVQNNTADINLDGEGDANSLTSDLEAHPDNHILAGGGYMREAQKIKLGDDLCSYEQDDGGDFCGSEASE